MPHFAVWSRLDVVISRLHLITIFLPMVSDSFLWLAHLYYCTSNTSKHTAGFGILQFLVWFMPWKCHLFCASRLLDPIWLHLSQVYQSFHLVTARAGLKLTEALENLTIYSTRISNESLGWEPSGQTCLRTYRVDYWFLTLHFIFIK